MAGFGETALLVGTSHLAPAEPAPRFVPREASELSVAQCRNLTLTESNTSQYNSSRVWYVNFKHSVRGI